MFAFWMLVVVAVASISWLIAIDVVDRKRQRRDCAHWDPRNEHKCTFCRTRMP